MADANVLVRFCNLRRIYIRALYVIDFKHNHDKSESDCISGHFEYLLPTNTVTFNTHILEAKQVANCACTFMLNSYTYMNEIIFLSVQIVQIKVET